MLMIVCMSLKLVLYFAVERVLNAKGKWATLDWDSPADGEGDSNMNIISHLQWEVATSGTSQRSPAP